MKKMTVFLTAGLGVAILTGCAGGNEVMKERYCKNTDGKEVTVSTPSTDIEATEPQQAVAKPQEVKVPETKTVVRPAYEPMQQLESDKFAGINENAKVPGKKSASAQTRIYKVKRGDTPGKIAYRHKVSVAALMQANNLTEEDARKLSIGRKLVIPAAGTKAVYKKSTAVAKKSKNVKSVKNTKSTNVDKSALNADGTYTIKRGDSPERIARKFKIKLADLLSANNLDENSSRRLQLGQKLIIPGASTTAVDSASQYADSKPVSTTPAATTSAVVSSDNTANVSAADASGSDLAAQLEQAAPSAAGDSSAAASAGTDNVVSHVVLEKEISLEDFAAKQKTTVEELRRINKKELPAVLKQNDLIDVPFAN